MNTRFIQTKVPDFLYIDRIYRIGSVVEVEDRRAIQLIELKHAEPTDGPAFEPEAPPEPEPETKTDPKKAKKADA